ncbi:MAG: hypothetical protein ACRYFX_25505 [Janthinobacterium lividum]
MTPSPQAATQPARTSWRLLALAGLLAALVLGLTYYQLLLHPGQFIIVNHYDGAKSYYSLATYLRQPLSQGLLEHGQNYPYGEYIFFTDIAPLLSVPLHGLVQAVPALGPYGLYLYDVFWLLGLVVGSLLLLSILRRLAVPVWLAVLLSVTLPWLGPQTFRLIVGHLSLSYAPAVLLPLWLLQGLYRAGQRGQATGRWWLGLGASLLGAAWLHFYYLGIVGGWLAFFFLGWGWQQWRAGRAWRPLAVRAVALLGTAVVGSYGLLQALDPRRHERTSGSGGYDWIEWKFQFGMLFHGHSFYKIRFPFERTGEIPYESTAYLGAFCLYGLLAVALLALVGWQRARRGPAGPALLPTLPASATDENRAFLSLLLLSSIPLALAALGESIDLDNGGYVIHNYLNPFLWVHKLTDRITQFRALGRFIWPFWWAVLLYFAWYAGQAWQQARPLGLRALWVALAALSVVDMLNVTHYYTASQKANFLAPPQLDEAQAQLGWLDPGRYQALLTLPFYHSGSEGTEPNLNIDPDDSYCNRSYQLGLLTGLPTLNHKATRTPAYQAHDLVTMTQPGGPSPALLALLDKRPILVYLDSAYYDGRNNYYRDGFKDRPEVLALFNRTPDFIREQHMRRLHHEGSVSIYEWQPK